MTSAEALNWLGADDPEDALDLFEEKLFELKQYFLQKPIISKLYLAQIRKIKTFSEVAFALGFTSDENDEKLQDGEFDFSENIIESVSHFEKLRSRFRLSVSSTLSPLDLEREVLQIVEIQQLFLKKWPEIEVEDDTIISREPDPMELLMALRTAQERGISHFSDLRQSGTELPEALLNEWKRLSLLRAKELEWKTSLKS